MLKKALAVSLGLAFLVLNPFYACSLMKKSYSFGADEMRAAVEGTWTITVPAAGPENPALEYTVTIAQSDRRSGSDDSAWVPSLVAPAAACGNRSLVKAAAACIDSTEMPLDVQIVKGPSVKSPRGELKVHGYTFKAGMLTLTLGTSEVRAVVSPDGVATDLELSAENAGFKRHGEMTRVAPPANAPAAATKT